MQCTTHDHLEQCSDPLSPSVTTYCCAERARGQQSDYVQATHDWLSNVREVFPCKNHGMDMQVHANVALNHPQLNNATVI